MTPNRDKTLLAEEAGMNSLEQRARVSPADAFDMGRIWQQSLQGQTLEDSRAVGRTLGCDLFDPIADEITAELHRVGFNSFESADHGICAAVAIIRAALSAPSPMEAAA